MEGLKIMSIVTPKTNFIVLLRDMIDLLEMHDSFSEDCFDWTCKAINLQQACEVALRELEGDDSADKSLGSNPLDNFDDEC